jgi:hypothetical protein
MRFLLFFICISFSCVGQSVDSLKILIKDIQKGKTDTIRLSANEKFYSGFEILLRNKKSFSMNFDSLKNVSIVSPEDSAFRLYTWIVPAVNGNSFQYFGFLQLHTDTGNTLITLKDSTKTIYKPESEKLNPEKWFGAVYYKVITVRRKKQKYYTLLGWKGKNRQVTQKLIEIIHITKNQVRFGFPLFKTGSVYKSRMVFSFNANTSMSLNYNDDYNGIVFDQLSNNKNSFQAEPGPDGTYNAFKWKKNKWQLYKDVDIRTRWEPKEIDQLPVSPDSIPKKYQKD